jgi:hypothetical protein
MVRRTDRHAVVAASDIGVVGYAGFRVLDTEGLIDADVRRRPALRDSPAEDEQLLSLLAPVRPDYLVKFVWAYPTLPLSSFPLWRRFGTLAIHRTPWTRGGLDRPPRASTDRFSRPPSPARDPRTGASAECSAPLG